MQLNEVTSPVRQRRADDIQALIVRRSQQTPVFPSVITLAAARLLDKYTDKSHMSHSGRPASVIVGRRSAVDSRQVAAMLPDRQTDVRYMPVVVFIRLLHTGIGQLAVVAWWRWRRRRYPSNNTSAERRHWI
jgi:uncharacterized protein YgbK (DUF1537 family)